MEVIVRVSSSYFEIDTSKYRLAISELTLIESLKQQTDKKFHLAVEVSPMDPCYGKRIAAFKAIKVPFESSPEGLGKPYYLPVPYTEIAVDDDTFLHSEMIASIRKKTVSAVNRRILAPNGYVFRCGKLQVCSEKPDMLEITQFVQNDRHVRDEVSFTQSHCWIHTRHAHNNSLLFDQKTSNEVTGLNWPGWQANILQKFCALRVTEATAHGAELYPTKSKSVVFARGSAKRRRKK